VRASVTLSGPVGSASEYTPVLALPRPYLTSCRFTTNIVGGYWGATIGVQSGHISAALGTKSVFPPPFCHAVIACDGSPSFEARLSEPEANAGWVTSLPLDGYFFTALEDRRFLSAATGIISGGVLLATAVDDAAPALRRGDWADGGGEWAAADWSGQLPSAMFGAVMKAGHPSGYPLDYRVWDNRTISGYVRVPPTAPDYFIAHDDAGLKRKWSAKGSYAAVVVGYTAHSEGSDTIAAGSSTTTVNHELGITPSLKDIRLTFGSYGGATQATAQNANDSTFDVVLDVNALTIASFGWSVDIKDVATARGVDDTFTDRMGIYRSTTIPGGTLDNVSAIAYRDAQLALRAYPTVSTTIKRTGFAGLGNTPPWFVRAGQTVLVEGDDAVLFVTQTSFDALAGTLDVTLGAPMPSFHESLRVLRDSDAAARAGLHPITGRIS
jgi:hypothetical protein